MLTARLDLPQAIDAQQIRAAARAAAEAAGLAGVAELRRYPTPPVGSTYQRTGTLARQTSSRVSETASGIQVDVFSSAPYATWVYLTGTGLYGPNKQMIRPVRAKALAWRATAGPLSGHWLFAKAVRGMPAWGNVQEALPKMRDTFLATFVAALKGR